MGRGRPSNIKAGDKKQTNVAHNKNYGKCNSEENDNQGTAKQETSQILATKMADTDTTGNIQKRRRGRPSKASTQNATCNGLVQTNINSALNNTDISSIDNNEHNATSEIHSLNSSDIINVEDETVIELFSTPVETSDCRRSLRKKNVKFDVCNLLKSNRRNHKIQIEARIDSNAPKQIEIGKSLDNNETKQKNFIEKSTIFRRFSNSESNKFSSKILLSSICNPQDVINSTSNLSNISIVDSIETDDKCQKLAENNLHNYCEQKIGSPSLNGSAEKYNINLCESQKLGNVIHENLENGKTTPKMCDGWNTEIVNIVKKTALDGIPTLPKRRGRKPKNLSVQVVASIDSTKGCKSNDNEDSSNETFITVGNEGDHSYSIIINNSQSDKAINKTIEKESDVVSSTGVNYLLEPTIDSDKNLLKSDTVSPKYVDSINLIKQNSKSISPKKKEIKLVNSPNTISSIDYIYIDSDSNSCEQIGKTKENQKLKDVIVSSNSTIKIDSTCSNNSKSPKAFSPVVLFNKIDTYSVKDNKINDLPLQLAITMEANTDIGNTAKKNNLDIINFSNLTDTQIINSTKKFSFEANDEECINKNTKILNGHIIKPSVVVSDIKQDQANKKKYVNSISSSLNNNELRNIGRTKLKETNIDEEVSKISMNNNSNLDHNKVVSSNTEEKTIITSLDITNQDITICESEENLKNLPYSEAIEEQTSFSLTALNTHLNEKNELTNTKHHNDLKDTSEIFDMDGEANFNKTEITMQKMKIKINLSIDKFNDSNFKQHETAKGPKILGSSIDYNCVVNESPANTIDNVDSLEPTKAVHLERTENQPVIESKTFISQHVNPKELESKISNAKPTSEQAETEDAFNPVDDVQYLKSDETNDDDAMPSKLFNLNTTGLELSEGTLKLKEISQCDENVVNNKIVSSSTIGLIDLTEELSLEFNNDIQKNRTDLQNSFSEESSRKSQLQSSNDLSASHNASPRSENVHKCLNNDESIAKKVNEEPDKSFKEITVETKLTNRIVVPQSPQIQLEIVRNLETNNEINQISPSKCRKSRWSSIIEPNGLETCSNTNNCSALQINRQIENTEKISIQSTLNTEAEYSTMIPLRMTDKLEQNVGDEVSFSISTKTDFKNLIINNEPLSTIENVTSISESTETEREIPSHKSHNSITVPNEECKSEILDRTPNVYLPAPITSRNNRFDEILENYQGNINENVPDTTDSKNINPKTDKDKFEENCSTNELELTNCENKIKKALIEIARKLSKDRNDQKCSSLNEREDNKSKSKTKLLNKRNKIIVKDLLHSMDLLSTIRGKTKTKTESSKPKRMKKKKNKFMNTIVDELDLDELKRKKKRHEHSKNSKKANMFLNENDTNNSILNSTKTSLSDKALSFLESFQLQNIDSKTFGQEQFTHIGTETMNSTVISSQYLPAPAPISSNSKLQKNETVDGGEMTANDPLGDIEKFIEAGESLLSYSRPAVTKQEDDSQNVENYQSASTHDYNNLINNFYEHLSDFGDSNASDSIDSTTGLNKRHLDINDEIFMDINEEDANSKSVRRSRRIKTKSKSSQSVVGRGLVGSAYTYSINGHKADLARIHIRNVNYLKEMEDRLCKFCMIEQNEYKCERVISKEARKMICDCFLTAEEEERGVFGCGDDCLNRLLMIECGPECVVGERCTNRRFHNLLYSPCQVFRTEKKGFGIHAESDIMPGEFIMEYVGEVIDGNQFAKRRDDYSKEKNKHYYFMALQNDCIIDATSRGNISRFINHSCDPNAETQKWTVNGELRIGFFSTKLIKAGDEITFDYQFQRYGKEAQKCYCESDNCRGWIGKEPESEEDDSDDNDDESGSEDEDVNNEESVDEENNEIDLKTLAEKNKNDSDEDFNDLTDVEIKKGLLKKGRGRKATSNKENRKANRKATRKYKRREIWIGKKNDHLEDMDIEDEVQSLLRSGLVNQEHTLRLSRLMVRSKMIETRLKLLEIIRDGDVPCRRLFLDYHGLRLLHGWMNEIIETESSVKNLEIRLALLDTLEVLPITNKNRLIDSKVYQTVQNWTKKRDLLNSTSPNLETTNDSESSLAQTETIEENIKTECVDLDNISHEDHLINEIKKLAEKLIIAWDALPENFKIPKRERIEQMKEHEREADQQYMSLNLMDEDNNSFNRSRYIKTRGLSESKYKWTSEKGEKLHRRALNESDGLGDSSLSKAERRELFAAKVVRDEVKKRIADQRREFLTKCRFFGYDPKRVTLKDLPFCVDSGTGQWYTADHKEIPTPPSHTHIVLPEKLKSTNPDDYELPEINLPPLWKYAIDERGRIYYYHSKIRIPQWLPPVKEEPIEEEKSSPIEKTEENNEESDKEEESDDSISCNEEDVEKLADEQEYEEYIENKLASYQEKRYNRMVKERPISPRREEDRHLSKIELRKYKENKEKIRKRKEEMRRRAKLAQADKTLENSSIDTKINDINDGTVPIHAYLYSSDEEPNIKVECSSPLIDSIIQCDKIVDELDAIRKRKSLKRSLIKEDYNIRKYVKQEKKIKLENENDDSGGSSNAQASSSSVKSKPKELDGIKYRKSREKFRNEIAGIIVQLLSRYLKDTCTIGRITSSEDFKHLARKLTHFVMLKEIKYCHAVGHELVVTESVKNKSKAFIKKYMTKYGPTYVRPNSDPEFKDISFNH